MCLRSVCYDAAAQLIERVDAEVMGKSPHLSRHVLRWDVTMTTFLSLPEIDLVLSVIQSRSHEAERTKGEIA